MGILKSFIDLLRGRQRENLENPPPELFMRPTPYERPPERKGKRFTDEERQAEREHLNQQLLPKNVARFNYDARRMMGIGATHFIWRTCQDERTCTHCQSLEGKRFAYSTMQSGKAPGTFICDNGKVCRCICEAVLK